MIIVNEELTLRKPEIQDIGAAAEILEKKFGSRLLRWYIARVNGDELGIELTLLKEYDDSASYPPLETVYPGQSAVLSIIPTGIGCEIGGYAGDAAPVTALLASSADYLVTNPNAVNASDFIRMPENMFYTEGFIIDLFSRGEVNLYKPYANRVGLIINHPDQSELEMIFNIMNTVRAVHGVHIEDYVITSASFGGRCERNPSGSYVGNIDHPEILFDACDQLVEKGVNAIAVTSNIRDLPLEDYAVHFEGKHPNPIGGAEAVISHLICKKYRIPAAHAPLLNVKDLHLKSRVVDARGAGEFSSPSGLACVLIGLSQAPQIQRKRCYGIKNLINIHNLLAVVAPAGALGGIPLIYAWKNNIPIIAVKQNQTILDITQSKLNLSNVIQVNNYPEAAGILQALKNGLSISSLYRPLATHKFLPPAGSSA